MGTNVSNPSTGRFQDQQQKLLGDHILDTQIIEGTQNPCTSKSIFVSDPREEFVDEFGLCLLEGIDVVVLFVFVPVG